MAIQIIQRGVLPAAVRYKMPSLQYDIFVSQKRRVLYR